MQESQYSVLKHCGNTKTELNFLQYGQLQFFSLFFNTISIYMKKLCDQVLLTLCFKRLKII